MKLEPDYSRSFVGIGDVHIYSSISPEKKFFAPSRAHHLLNRIKEGPHPAAVFQIGDISEFGRPDEHVIAEDWWADWDPIPKIICVGNHDIDNGVDVDAVVGDTLPQWEARYGSRVQVLESDAFRLVTCLWTQQYFNGTSYVDQPGGRWGGLNAVEGRDYLRDIIDDSPKPTVLGFHYPLANSVPGTTGAEGDNATVTAAGHTNLRYLIDNCPNLQLVLSGHTHTSPWYSHWNSMTAAVGTVTGRACRYQNLCTTTYHGSLGDTRGRIIGFFYTFHENHFEARLRDIENDLWVPRSYGLQRVERYPYT